MKETNDDLFDAGRLIQYALQPAISPERSEEYGNLIERYLDRLEFQDQVRRIAAGLGLEIIGEVRPYFSIVLAPKPESAFLMRSREYRTSRRNDENKRVLDGLIHIAIAATVYPRDTDLIEDLNMTGHRLVTVNEIEIMLREIVARLEEANKANPDPPHGADDSYEVWRIYKNCPSTKKTIDNRAAPGTTRRIIEEALEFLCKQRCFRKEEKNYRPLRRYRVLVQEYAASRVYQAVKRVLETKEGVI